MKEVKINKNGEVKEKSIIREIFDWVVCIVVAFTLSSMTPTILDGERVIINRLFRTFHLPVYRGDIITFEAPEFEDGNISEGDVAVYEEPKTAMEFFIHNVLEIGKRSYIKRVIGVGGDHVKIGEDGNVYVNDILQEEVYLNGIKTPQRHNGHDDVVVPEGYIYVMGDNRGYSKDSRELGCIPLSKVEGRVKIRVWPSIGKIDK